jgi:hypothetical protein
MAYFIPFDSFNDSAMLSKPKCVVFSSLRLGFCSARYGEDEKARTGTGVATRVESRNRFAARGTNEDMVVYGFVLASQPSAMNLWRRSRRCAKLHVTERSEIRSGG